MVWKGISLKNVPTVAWYCITVVILAIIGAFVVFGVTATDSTEFRSFLNTVLNLSGTLLGGGSMIYAGAAARNSEKAVKQTNGELDKRIEEGAQRALIRHNFTINREGDDGRPSV